MEDTINNEKKNFKFNIGDKVRISKARAALTKAYKGSWSKKKFFISDREWKNLFQPTYKIKDYNCEENSWHILSR